MALLAAVLPLGYAGSPYSRAALHSSAVAGLGCSGLLQNNPWRFLQSLQQWHHFTGSVLPAVCSFRQASAEYVPYRFGTEQAMLLAWQKCFLELDPDAIYMFEVHSHQPCQQCPAFQLCGVLLMHLLAYMSNRIVDLHHDSLLHRACLTCVTVLLSMTSCAEAGVLSCSALHPTPLQPELAEQCYLQVETLQLPRPTPFKALPHVRDMPCPAPRVMQQPWCRCRSEGCQGPVHATSPAPGPWPVFLLDT